MIREVIQEYLVSLGVKVDKPGFNQMQTTLNQASTTVSTATSGWVKNFVAAGTIIGTALASVSASIAGVMVAAAKQDLNLEKYARSMLVSKGAAMEMKTAIDALGESVQDIQLTPELMQRYRALVADGRNMKVGGDYEGTMKNFRDLIFEFTRLKQEASYALQWVGYYLMKHLAKPLAEAKASFRSFNDSLIKTMPVWTEKISRALVYIINVGKHFLDLLKAVGKSIYDMWDAFPRGIKIATASMAGFFMLLRASPIGKFLTLFGSLLLLADDYFGYMEGKQAAMGSVWDKLNQYMDIAKQKLAEWGDMLAPVWDAYIKYVKWFWGGIGRLIEVFGDWMQEVGQSEALSEFVAIMQELGSAFYDLSSGIVDLVSAAFRDLLDSLQKHDMATKFTDLMERLKDILWGLFGVLRDCIQTVAQWFSEIARSEEMRDFIDAVVELFGALTDLFNALMDLVTVAFSGFYGEMEKTQKAYTFRDAVKAVVGMISSMVRVLSTVIELLAKFFKMMSDNRIFKEFWRGMGQAVKVFSDIVFGAIGMVGKLGQALMALVRGDFKRAAKLAGEAFSGKAEAKGRDNRFAGTGDAQRDAWIMEAAKKYGVPASKVAAMMETESSFIPDALSKEGATGYMQLMPDTFSGLGFDDIRDPYQNIMAGAKYMAQMYEQFGNWDLVYAAYNAGPQAVKDANYGIPDISETRNHVRKVNDNEAKYLTATTYTVQPGVEDSDLSGVNSDLRGNFDSLADYLHKQGYQIEVSSGRRSVENNAASNGASNSNHLNGEAIDFIVNGDYDPKEVETLARQYGLKVLYHDAGSGLHFHVENDSDGPSLFDRTVNYASEKWKDLTGGSGNDLFSAIASGFANADPIILNGLMQGTQPAYAQSAYGGSTNITYHVEVGGVNVTKTSATAEDIGNAVGEKTVSNINDRATYVLQNRALNGIQV